MIKLKQLQLKHGVNECPCQRRIIYHYCGMKIWTYFFSSQTFFFTHVFLTGHVLTLDPGIRVAQCVSRWFYLVLDINLYLIRPLSLLQCGFFHRVRHEDQVPQYQAVKILRQETPLLDKTFILHKKQWTTHWSDGTI